MPSEFETEIAGELVELDSTFGRPATYFDSVVNSIPNIFVRLRPEVFRNVPRESRAMGQMQRGQLIIQKAFVAKPVKGGRVQVEGEVWTIDTTPSLQNGRWTCECTRSGTEKMMERRVNDNA